MAKKRYLVTLTIDVFADNCVQAIIKGTDTVKEGHSNYTADVEEVKFKIYPPISELEEMKNAN
jgi:hypothetical protein